MHPAFTSTHRSVTARQYAVTLWGCGMLLMGALACAQEPVPAGDAPPVEAPPDATASNSENKPEDTNKEAEAPGGAGNEVPEKPMADPTEDAQPVPQGYPESRYAAVWAKNPFQTKIPIVRGPPGPGLADDWNLSSVTSVGNSFTIRIRNNKTNESRKLTDQADKDGFMIEQVNANRDRKLVTAKIKKGTESAELKYPDTVLGGGGGGGGAPVAPGTAGRMPGQTGVPNASQNRPGMPMRTGMNQPMQTGMGTPQQQAAALAAQKQQATMNGGGQRPLTGPGGVPLPTSTQNPNTFQRPMAPGISNAQGAPPSPVQRRRVLIPQPIPAPDGNTNNPVP